MQIGIIGLGRLGLALARGLDRSKKVELIYGFSRDKEKGKTAVRQAGSLSLRDSETEIFELCDIIFLWTKGSDAQEVLERNSGIIGRRLPVIVSCTTGVPLAGYTPRWAECLPNVNMAAGFGATIIHYASNLSESDRQIINDILRLTGTIHEVSGEDLHLYSAISSCGPALYSTMLELFADTLGRRHDFGIEFCRKLMMETVLGTIHLQELDKIDSIEIVQRVAHPGGSSEAGVNYLNSVLPEIYKEMLKAMKKW